MEITNYKSELTNTLCILYFTNDGKIHRTNIKANLNETTGVNKEIPWVEGAYGNCLIALKSKQTDYLYIVKDDDNIANIVLNYDDNNNTWNTKENTDVLEKYCVVITRNDI